MNIASNFNISSSANLHSTVLLLGGNIVIEDGVKIGPYCVIEGNITIKKNTQISSHVVISGNTTIGESNTIHSFAAIGGLPQDIKYKGEESYTVIGNNNIIREHVTINAGTAHGGYYTKIGDNNLLMISCHIGHDCELINNIIISNNVGIAGHVKIAENVIIGGNSGIHQFVQIGANVMIGGMSGVGVNIPPFTLYDGSRQNAVRGLNIVGLKRHGFTSDVIKEIKNAYNMIFFSTDTLNNALKIKTTNQYVQKIINFIVGANNRPIAIWDTKNIELDV